MLQFIIQSEANPLSGNESIDEDDGDNSEEEELSETSDHESEGCVISPFILKIVCWQA